MSTRRGFFGSIFGGIAAAICPRPVPAAPSLDDLYQHVVKSFNSGPHEYADGGFVWYSDPDPVCFTAENGRLVRFDPGKEPS